MILKPQFIIDFNGKRKAVILSMKEFEYIVEQLEDLEDIRLYDEAKKDNGPSIPFEEYKKQRNLL